MRRVWFYFIWSMLVVATAAAAAAAVAAAAPATVAAAAAAATVAAVAAVERSCWTLSCVFRDKHKMTALVNAALVSPH